MHRKFLGRDLHSPAELCLGLSRGRYYLAYTSLWRISEGNRPRKKERERGGGREDMMSVCSDSFENGRLVPAGRSPSRTRWSCAGVAKGDLHSPVAPSGMAQSHLRSSSNPRRSYHQRKNSPTFSQSHSDCGRCQFIGFTSIEQELLFYTTLTIRNIIGLRRRTGRKRR